MRVLHYATTIPNEQAQSRSAGRMVKNQTASPVHGSTGQKPRVTPRAERLVFRRQRAVAPVKKGRTPLFNQAAGATSPAQVRIRAVLVEKIIHLRHGIT